VVGTTSPGVLETTTSVGGKTTSGMVGTTSPGGVETTTTVGGKTTTARQTTPTGPCLEAQLSILTVEKLNPTPNPSKEVWTVVLPNVGDVTPTNYQIMQIIINGGGSITPVTVTIIKPDKLYSQGPYASSPIEFLPTVSGTQIILTFEYPVIVTELEVYVCVPFVTTTPSVFGTTTTPGLIEKTTPIVVGTTTGAEKTTISRQTTTTGPCPDESSLSILTVEKLKPSPNPSKEVWTVVLPNVDDVIPLNYQIMKIIINGGGPITPVTVTIVKPDNEYSLGPYASSPIEFLPAVSGTQIILTFKSPVNVQQLEIYVCVPPLATTEYTHVETITISKGTPPPQLITTTPTVVKTTATIGTVTITFTSKVVTTGFTTKPTTPINMCIVTADAYAAVMEGVPADLLPPPPLFGWIEKDGNLGDHNGATSPNEVVNQDERIEQNVVVNISPCYSCICDSELKFDCSIHNDTWFDKKDQCLIKFCNEVGEVVTKDTRQICECSENEDLVMLNSVSPSGTGLCCECRPRPYTTAVTPPVTPNVTALSTTGPLTTTAPIENTTPFTQATTPLPCLPCHLEVRQESKISFNTKDGDFCETLNPVSLTRCEGSCPTYDDLRIQESSNGTIADNSTDQLLSQDQDCKCCKGTGTWQPIVVSCGKGGQKVVEVMKYDKCECLLCSGGAP
jgi:hypothetical protein